MPARARANTKPVCFGFEISSPFRFDLTRPGAAAEGLRIAALERAPAVPAEPPLFHWTIDTGDGEVDAALYGRDGVFEFWNSDVGWFRIVPRERLVEIPTRAGVHPARREQVLWNMPATVCAVECGRLALHASAVEIDGEAVLVAGPGYHGKTTLALAFHEAGFRVLTEDIACCRVGPRPVVLPGPAMLRVRAGQDAELHVPEGMEIVARQGGRVQLAIAPDRRGDAEPVPIRAVAFLRESSAGVHLDAVPAQRAIADLWALAFHLPTSGGRARCFSQVADLASGVSILNLYRPYDLAALDEIVARLVTLREP